MRRGTLLLLLVIVLLAVGAAFVVFWPHSDTGQKWHGINNPYSIKLGLDLQGGVSVLLVPDPAQHYTKAEVDGSIDSTPQQISKPAVSSSILKCKVAPSQHSANLPGSILASS